MSSFVTLAIQPTDLLASKTAIITGVVQGIGFAIARTLARHGEARPL